MARWRLTAQHYLNVPGNEWEQKETNRETGKQAVKRYKVPMLLNPDDPSDCNYPGEVIVCHEGKGEPRDITFVGSPTPDMEPMDAEAKAISDELRPAWEHPIEGLAAQGGVEDYAAKLVAAFEKQMNALPKNASAKGAKPDELAELKRQIAELTARLDAKPEAPAARRA